MFLKRLKIIEIFFLICFFGFYIASYLGIIQSFDDLSPTVIVTRENFKDKQGITLYKDKSIIGELTSKYNNLGIVAVKFNTHFKINDDFLRFRIREKGGDWFYSANYKVDQFQPKRYFTFGFPQQDNSKNKSYEFELTSLNGSEGNVIDIDSSENQFLYKCGYSKDYLLSHKSYIPTFILNKTLSLFSHLDWSFHVKMGILFILVFLLFRLIKFVYIHLKNKNIVEIIDKKILVKDFYFKIFFLVVSFLIFLFLVFKPQTLIYDASGYVGIGSLIEASNFNIFKVDLVNRTYVFPLFLAFLIRLSNLIKIDDLTLMYFVNYVFFVLSTFLVSNVLKKYNKKIANIFLFLSAFNIVSLSFTNTVLTEPIVLLFVCLLFNLLNKKIENNIGILFLIGLVNALSVLTRPSNMIVFLAITVWIVFLCRKKIVNFLFYILPVLVVFLVSFSYTYTVEKRFGLFTSLTSGIYDMQINRGVGFFKYETTVDKKYNSPSVYYENHSYMAGLGELTNCTHSVECAYKFITKDPLNYVLLMSIHLFTLFDRNYIYTYVNFVDKIDFGLIFYNYVILSSLVCGLLFFVDKKLISKYKNLIFTSLLLIVGTLFIYIPTVVEARYSAPVYTLIVAFASFYFYKLLKQNSKEKNIKIILLQLFLMLLFTMLSYVIRQTAYLELRWVG